MAKKAYEESRIAAIAEKIREKTGGSATYTTARMPSGIEEVYSVGYTEGYNDGSVLNQYISTWSIVNLFREAVFPQDFDLVFELNNDDIYSIDSIFHSSQNLKSIKLINKGNKDSAINASSAFRSVGTLETIDLTEFNRKFSLMNWTFLSSSKLKGVHGALDFSECTSATLGFSGAVALEDIEFVPNTINISIDFYWCTKLSDASLRSIIEGLSDDTSELTVTLPKSAIDTAFETAEGLADGSESSAWWALTILKPNWTISTISLVE